jgi:hypothetical protein
MASAFDSKMKSRSFGCAVNPANKIQARRNEIQAQPQRNQSQTQQNPSPAQRNPNFQTLGFIRET